MARGGPYFVSGLTNEGGHDEWIEIGSGEGDDERKGHSFGEVNVNSKQCSGAPSPQLTTPILWMWMFP